MNKSDKIIIVALFSILVGWWYLNRDQLRPVAPAVNPAGSAEAGAVAGPPPVAAPVQPAAPVTAPGAGAQLTAIPPLVAEAAEAITALAPEQVITLESSNSHVRLSSHSGGISSIVLDAFLEEQSGTDPVVLDFASFPTLSLSGIPGLEPQNEFTVEASADGTSAIIQRTTAAGIAFTREIQLVEDYHLKVTDRFENTTAAPIALPRHAIAVGPMGNIDSKAQTQGITYLGLDTLPAQAGKNVVYWGKKLNDFFGAKSSMMSCGRVDGRLLPLDAARTAGEPVVWLAAKNKFFVQIYAPDQAADDCNLFAYRDREKADILEVKSVAGSMLFAERELAPGQVYERPASLYVGPKKYDLLKVLGHRQAEVMQFGWWDWYRGLCSLLLGTLNWLYGWIPNYGVAIILLTFIVRMIFWPVTHKSTVHMKRMQQIQPLVAEIRKKYKENPQKINQETMALYKEHKVNPLAGCLPMLVQIPVFIALFTVLRSAVELRFAGFLWVADLSEPEGLWADKLGFAINILPLLMTATTILQQRLTPSVGDPQQQKIMMFMPVIFLFLFYSMPSALVLYWTVSQSLAILQLVMQKGGFKKAPVAVAAGTVSPQGFKPMAVTGSRAKKSQKR